MDAVATSTAELAPRCPACGRRHLADLPCWRGAYAQRITDAVLTTQGRVCWLGYPGCTRRATTADHIVERSHGGTDHPDNLAPACRPCNSRRQNRAPFEPDPEPRPTGVGLSPRWRTTT